MVQSNVKLKSIIIKQKIKGIKAPCLRQSIIAYFSFLNEFNKKIYINNGIHPSMPQCIPSYRQAVLSDDKDDRILLIID